MTICPIPVCLVWLAPRQAPLTPKEDQEWILVPHLFHQAIRMVTAKAYQHTLGVPLRLLHLSSPEDPNACHYIRQFIPRHMDNPLEPLVKAGWAWSPRWDPGFEQWTNWTPGPQVTEPCLEYPALSTINQAWHKQHSYLGWARP